MGFANSERTTMGFAMHASLGSSSGPQWDLTTIEGVPRWDLPCMPPWAAVVDHNGI